MDIRIKPIEPIGSTLPSLAPEKTKDNEASTPFSQIFGMAMDNINAASNTVKIADKKAIDFSLGRMDNPEELMIAQEKASLAINYTTKITNKLLEVYNEIMRMQI